MKREVFSENKAQNGLWAALYYKNSTGKFSIFAPAEKIPSCSGDTESSEIDVTTSPVKAKLMGKETLNDIEFDVFNHRDNIRMLEGFKGKTMEFMSLSADYSGEHFAGTISYKVGERSSGEASKITVKITPTVFYGVVLNGLPLIQETAKFASAIDSVIELDASGTYTADIVLDPADATFTAASESDAIATATVASNKLTITAKAEGSTLVTLTSNKDGCAPWVTSILVQVNKATPSA